DVCSSDLFTLHSALLPCSLFNRRRDFLWPLKGIFTQINTSLKNMTSPKFPKIPTSFHSELKKRINDYFKQRGKSPTGNFNLHLKAIIFISLLVGIYVHLVFFTPSGFWAVMEAVLLGLVTAAIGFNVMHDGAH